METEKKKKGDKNIFPEEKTLADGKTLALCFVIADLDRNNHNIVISGSEIIRNKYKKKRRPTNHWKIGQEE